MAIDRNQWRESADLPVGFRRSDTADNSGCHYHAIMMIGSQRFHCLVGWINHTDQRVVRVVTFERFLWKLLLVPRSGDSLLRDFSNNIPIFLSLSLQIPTSWTCAFLNQVDSTPPTDRSHTERNTTTWHSPNDHDGHLGY